MVKTIPYHSTHIMHIPGIYRALYIANWIYRSYYEPFYQHNWVVYTCGIIQTCLYVDFFYYYFLRYVCMSHIHTHTHVHTLTLIMLTSHCYSKYKGGKFSLPN